jgi:YihY family inner membrane protein
LAELSTTEASAAATSPAISGTPPVKQSKWYIWRRDCKSLFGYLLDSEIHTYAFSVAANAILSFIPFCVLLYTLAYRVFNSTTMVHVIDQMVNYFLPTHTHEQDWLARNILAAAIRSSAGGVQIISLIMILIACTGIFLPLEVALNQAWGVTKSRNYLYNQVVALALALIMVLLGVGSIYLNLGAQTILTFLFFHHIDNFVFRGLSYCWLAISTGVASILFFFAIYWLLPNRRVPWRHVLRTAIITGIVWLLSKMLFVAVLPHLNLEDLYGPFFISVGLLFWAYISGLILFAGAQFSVSRWSGDKK